MLLTILLSIRNWTLLLLFTIAVTATIRFSLPRPADSLRRLLGFYWFYLLNFIFILFFTEHLFSFQNWSEWLDSSWGWAAFYTLRLVNIIALMLYLGYWLRADELILSIISGTSGGKTTIPLLQHLLWTLLFAYHFLPLLRRDVQRMRMSVLARGLSFRGALTQRLRVYLTFLVPLLNSVFRRADALVKVLATRHFDPGSRRTTYHIYRMQSRDWFLVFLSTLACGWLVW